MSKMITAAALLAVLGASACTTVQYPSKRPLTQDAMQQLGETDVAVYTPNEGMMVSWYQQDSSATSAQYGLVGAITGAIIDAIVNAGPAARAERVANEVYDVISPDMLATSLVDATVGAVEGDETAYVVTFGEATAYQPLASKDKPKDVFVVRPVYSIAENASTFQVRFDVSLLTDEMAYVTPYTFEGSVPKEQLSGDLYKNQFVYNSRVFAVPELDEALKAQLVDAVRHIHLDENGQPPEPDSKEDKAMAKDLENAQDDKLTKSEASILMIHNWTDNDGEALKSEVEQAHQFLNKYLLLDVNSDEVPSLTAPEISENIVETQEDGRLVFKIMGGTMSGSYVSRPGNVEGFATYGNALMTSPKANQAIRALKEDLKQAK